jgi:hypothetical protein
MSEMDLHDVPANPGDDLLDEPDAVEAEVEDALVAGAAVQEADLSDQRREVPLDEDDR